MDQTAHKKILGMINFVSNFFDFRMSRVLDNKGPLPITSVVVLSGVHAGCYVAGLPLCCWVQDVMVGDVVVLGAWLLVGFGSVCFKIGINLILKNFSFSVLNLGLLLCSSWWTPSPGCWLGWCSWGPAWSLSSVGLCWHSNRVCQNVVSHLVICHPSILVVY